MHETEQKLLVVLVAPKHDGGESEGSENGDVVERPQTAITGSFPGSGS